MATYGQVSGHPFDPTRGYVIVTALDCAGHPAPGVSFAIDNGDSETVAIYADRGAGERDGDPDGRDGQRRVHVRPHRPGHLDGEDVGRSRHHADPVLHARRRVDGDARDAAAVTRGARDQKRALHVTNAPRGEASTVTGGGRVKKRIAAAPRPAAPIANDTVDASALDVARSARRRGVVGATSARAWASWCWSSSGMTSRPVRSSRKARSPTAALATVTASRAKGDGCTGAEELPARRSPRRAREWTARSAPAPARGPAPQSSACRRPSQSRCASTTARTPSHSPQSRARRNRKRHRHAPRRPSHRLAVEAHVEVVVIRRGRHDNREVGEARLEGGDARLGDGDAVGAPVLARLRQRRVELAPRARRAPFLFVTRGEVEQGAAAGIEPLALGELAARFGVFPGLDELARVLEERGCERAESSLLGAGASSARARAAPRGATRHDEDRERARGRHSHRMIS